MLTASGEAGYIHEPFNPVHDPGVCTLKPPYWFLYLNAENEMEAYPHLLRTIQFRYNLLAGFKGAKDMYGRYQAMRMWARFNLYRLKRVRPLIKDPIAVLSSEWLAKKFEMQVVVMIRNPFGFAGSIKVRNWGFSVDQFLNQPQLMRDHLAPLESEFRAFQESSNDTIDQAAIAWKTIYSVVLKFRQRHPEWIFLRHEDISRNPQEGFKELYKRLGLTFTEKAAQTVESYSTEESSENQKKDFLLKYVQHVSTMTVESWKQRLTEDEISRIKKVVGEVANQFYPEQDW
jgi:hypothetical protein